MRHGSPLDVQDGEHGSRMRPVQPLYICPSSSELDDAVTVQLVSMVEAFILDLFCSVPALVAHACPKRARNLYGVVFRSCLVSLLLGSVND